MLSPFSVNKIKMCYLVEQLHLKGFSLSVGMKKQHNFSIRDNIKDMTAACI